MNEFGSNYYEPGAQTVVNARSEDLYYYQAYIGHHHVEVQQGDCVYYIDSDTRTVHVKRGPITIDSKNLAVIIRGYMPSNRSCEINPATILPYINGCSTRQLFHSERIGDPTLQLLKIPPHTSEQAHHIHSTVRIAYIYSGKGQSIVGMQTKSHTEPLYPGKVAILQPMCPHHFMTEDSELIVIPLHVFSSTRSEFNHPMFNGTHIIHD